MAILTGSRAYGKPTEKSDIDVAVLIEEDDLLRIIDAMGKWASTRSTSGSPGRSRPSGSGRSISSA